MILRSLEVDGFRCFDRLLRVEGFSEGLNVLAGPNGAGKSTLLRALRHVLLDSHGLTGAGVRQAMMPWGRTLYPRIRAEFLHGDTEWQIEKKFLSNAYARLERKESGAFRPVAEGREAEAKVREMLLAAAAPKGLAGEEHLGLLQVLWTPQGAPPPAAWNASVRTTLQESFGAALRSPAAEQIAALADKRYEEYFTPTGQQRKSSPIVPLEAEWTGLQREVQLLRDQWRRAGESREILATLRAEIAEAAARLAVDRPRLEQERARQSAAAEAAAAEAKARSHWEELSRRVAAWREEIGAEGRIRRELAEAEALHGAAASALREAQLYLPKIEELETGLEQLAARGADAKAWPDWVRWRDLSAALQGLRGQLLALRPPPAASMEEARKLDQQIHLKRAGLEAASLRVTLTAETALAVDADGGQRTVAAGETLVLTGPQRIDMRIPGVARLTAASANAHAVGLAQDVETLSKRLSALLQGETLAAWEERFAAGQQWQREMDGLAAEVRPLELRRAELEQLAERHQEWTAAAPDIETIRAEWRTGKDALDAARGRYNLAALTGAEASARTQCDGLRAQAAQLAARLTQHAAAEPLAGVEVRLEQAQLAYVASRTQFHALQSASHGDTAAWERDVRTQQELLSRKEVEAARLEGELAVALEQNLYSRLAEAEERITERAASLAAHRRRAAAIQLVRATLADAQKEMTAALPDQIAGQATRYWRRISGDDSPAIRIGADSWAPDGLAVPGAVAALHELSGGEAEQIAFAARLALAGQLTQSSRQLAVFDDAFLATDAGRAARILEMLAEAGQQMQILILTCHPARYASLPEVRVFDLPALQGH